MVDQLGDLVDRGWPVEPFTISNDDRRCVERGRDEQPSQIDRSFEFETMGSLN